MDLYAVASGPVDCGLVRRSLGEGGLWIPDLSAEASAKTDCGLNGEATTEQISPRRPQRTQRGTWGKAKRQRTRRREGRGRREPQTRSRQPCEALKGRQVIAQWREPWGERCPPPPFFFPLFRSPIGAVDCSHGCSDAVFGIAQPVDRCGFNGPAPTGRRTVATGEATPLSASRNPWEGSCFNTSAPTHSASLRAGGAEEWP